MFGETGNPIKPQNNNKYDKTKPTRTTPRNRRIRSRLETVSVALFSWSCCGLSIFENARKSRSGTRRNRVERSRLWKRTRVTPSRPSHRRSGVRRVRSAAGLDVWFRVGFDFFSSPSVSGGVRRRRTRTRFRNVIKSIRVIMTKSGRHSARRRTRRRLTCV